MAAVNTIVLIVISESLTEAEARSWASFLVACHNSQPSAIAQAGLLESGQPAVGNQPPQGLSAD